MCMIKLPYSNITAINNNVKTNSYHLALQALRDKLDLLAARYYWFENRGQRGIVCHPSRGLWSACVFKWLAGMHQSTKQNSNSAIVKESHVHIS